MKAAAIKALTTKVTKKWAKQIKREERSRRAALNRRDYLYSDRVCATEIAWPIVKAAYHELSQNGKLSVHARQLYYAVREPIREKTNRDSVIDSKYFTQNLLPRLMAEHPEAMSWRVVYDPRGHFIEPHTKKKVPIGTIDVDGYLRDIKAHELPDVAASDPIKVTFPTCGTRHRISAVLFIEKEGFNPLFRDVQLAERYDLAIMSTKGQSTVAARKLVDHLCADGRDVPLLVLHDFDKWGLSIAENLTEVSAAAEESGRIRYEFANRITAIDFGLRLKDVEEWNLPSERVKFTGAVPSLATAEEAEFLRSNRRVELNAFKPADFIGWIEAKLDEHGIKKLIPSDAAIETAYRRSVEAAWINSKFQEITPEAEEKAGSVQVPKNLAVQIRKRLKKYPAQPWDEALANIAEKWVGENQD